MNKLLVITTLLLTACGGGSSSSQQTARASDSSDSPMLDPTLPSWAPKSCLAYHKVAVEAMHCNAIEQTRRDQIQQQYGEASQAWKAEENADTARVDEIAQACVRSSDAVHAEITGNCAEAKQ